MKPGAALIVLSHSSKQGRALSCPVVSCRAPDRTGPSPERRFVTTPIGRPRMGTGRNTHECAASVPVRSSSSLWPALLLLVCHQILPESFRKSRNTVRDGISSAFMAPWAAVGHRREPRPGLNAMKSNALQMNDAHSDIRGYRLRRLSAQGLL